MSSRNTKISCSHGARTQDIAVPAGEPREPTEVEVEGLAAGGRGVARPDGRAWFVPGVVPGDRALVEIGRDHGRFVEAELIRVIRSAPDRRDPPCVFQPRCGGCPWMILEDETQLTWKSRLVADALRRIGGLDGIDLQATRSGSARLRYRNKSEFTLGRDEAGKPCVGFHPTRRRTLVDIPRCEVQQEGADRVLATLREIVTSPAFRVVFDTSQPFRVALRSSGADGRVLVVIREAGKVFPRASRFARELMGRRPEVMGVVRVRHPAGRRGGGKTIPVAGEVELHERIAGLDYRIPAASFLQVNPEMAEVLIESVREFSGDVSGAQVLDLYGGIGVYGTCLVRQGASVTVCEADREATECGAAAVERGGLSGIRFVRSDVLRFLEAEARGADVIVANPPRSGLGPGVARAILAQRPRRVILVSCDPATFARDARALAEGGLRTERVRPIDLFPQTAQVELVALLRAVDG